MAAIPDRAERAFVAHRDALQEIDRAGENYERTMIVDALIVINEWGDRSQAGDLISEILYAADAAELDTATRRSLETTLEYLSEV
jgi:hypothetical protein